MFRRLWNKYRHSLKKDILVHILVIIGLFGMVCIALSSCLESDTASEQEKSAVPEVNTQEAYRISLQSQLSEMLSQIDGVGRTEVLVTLQGSESYHYAQDAESRYVTVGGSQKEALVESVSLPTVTGVVVACEGGGINTIKEMVYQTVSVACGLRMSQIYVTKLDSPA